MVTLFFAIAFTVLAAPAVADEAVEIRIVYDNTAANSGFQEDWGFAAIVTTRGSRVLFDSGANADIFLQNLDRHGVPPDSIGHVVISHHHSDHITGLYRLALRAPEIAVYFLDSFPDDVFELAMAVGVYPIRVTGPAEIAPGIRTTGPIGGKYAEQALVVETPAGPIVMVGRGRPGLVKIVETVKEERKTESIRLLLGGFQMMRQDKDEINATIVRLKELNVESVAPAHDSGEKSKRLFRHAWGDNYVACGAGRTILLR